MTDSLLGQAFVYLTASVIAVPLAQRFGLGSVLGYLLAGVAIGPFALGLVGTGGQDVMHFAEFGVVMMLFVIGLELQPSLLWRLRGPILGLGGLQVIVTAIVFAAVALGLGLPVRAAAAIGMTLSLSSTAIVLQTLSERGLMGTSGGQNAFAVLLFQDIAVIPMLAIFPLLAAPGAAAGSEAHGADTFVAHLPAWGQTLAVLAAVGLVIGSGRFVFGPALHQIARTRLREMFTAATLLLVVGIALLMSAVGLSPALGTFLAGVVLANSEYRHELESDIEPFKGLLLGLFFIAVGASIDFGLIVARPFLILALVVAILAVKLGVLYGLARLFRSSVDQALLLAFALPQVGEFAFVLFSFADQQAVLSPAISAPLVASVALTMAATPLLLLVNERVVQPALGTRAAVDRPADVVDQAGTVLIAGFGSFGSTVGRLLRASGVSTTVLDVDSDRVDLLRRLGLTVYYGDATRLDLLESAGAGRARMLVIALDTPERTLELVHTAGKHFPGLTILARAFDWQDAHDLHDAGVEHVYRDTLDTSLRLGADALRLLGVRGYRAHRAAQRFLKHDEESVRALTALRSEDRSGYVTAARERIAALERMFEADRAEPALDRDEGWDAESLRAEARYAELRSSSGSDKS